MAHDQEAVGSNPGTVYWMDVSQWFPTFLRLGSTYKWKTNLGSTMMAYTDFWEHLLVSSWEQLEENSRHLGIFGSTWWKFWEHFWSREHWLGNTDVSDDALKKFENNGSQMGHTKKYLIKKVILIRGFYCTFKFLFALCCVLISFIITFVINFELL